MRDTLSNGAILDIEWQGIVCPILVWIFLQILQSFLCAKSTFMGLPSLMVSSSTKLQWRVTILSSGLFTIITSWHSFWRKKLLVFWKSAMVTCFSDCAGRPFPFGLSFWPSSGIWWGTSGVWAAVTDVVAAIDLFEVFLLKRGVAKHAGPGWVPVACCRRVCNGRCNRLCFSYARARFNLWFKKSSWVLVQRLCQ